MKQMTAGNEGVVMILTRVLKGVVVAIFASAVLTATAQAGWYTYTVADGLASSDVREMLEDRDGTLWFGTSYGLSRYDGVNWTTQLATEHVQCLLEDHNGVIWCGTATGLFRYDGVGWVTVPLPTSGIGPYTIEEDHYGNLWCGFGFNADGAARYDGGSWRWFTSADGLAYNDVYAIREDAAGNLWFGTRLGLSRYDGVTWRTYTANDGLPHLYVYSIFPDSRGNLWVGTAAGICRFDGRKWYSYPTSISCDLCNRGARHIFEDHQGNVWLMTWDGIIRWDGVDWRSYTAADGLSNDNVNVGLQDSRGNFWFGTTGGGVIRYDGSSSRTFTKQDGLGMENTYAIGEDSSGNVWVGTYCGGPSRLDETSWTTFGIPEGLPNTCVESLLGDRKGNVWVGFSGAGVSKYDGTSWTTYTTADGLAGNYVDTILEDRNGNMWFGTTYGLSKFDGTHWHTYSQGPYGLADNSVKALAEDSHGRIWVGYSFAHAVSWFNGLNWVTYTPANGLIDNVVTDIIENRDGNMWFATPSGISLFDPYYETWQTLTSADGLVYDDVSCILQDLRGNMWFGTWGGGVCRYDGTNWGTYGLPDGLPAAQIKTMFEDRKGRLWFGTQLGVTMYEPDTMPPRTVISQPPLRLSSSTTQNIGFAAAYGEVGGILFSYSFDGAAWSAWSTSNVWPAANLSDGAHTFQVRARDRIGNVDTTAATCTFEIDATPPVAVITSPASGGAVRGVVPILGAAADLRFRQYRVEARASGATSWDSLFQSSSPVVGGELCAWTTEHLGDGNYELRLSVTDTLGLTGTTLVGVIVDNVAPWVNETVPAVVSAASGGDIYTTNREAHLYFPPHAFGGDTDVDMTAQADSLVPDALPGGQVRVLPGYEISWGDAVLAKAATLEMSYAGWDGTAVAGLGKESGAEPYSAGGATAAATQEPAYAQPALYVLGSDSTWARVGGTVDRQGERVSAAITDPGRYSLFLEHPGTGDTGISSLSALSLTPRVFSPNGAFANDNVAIGFTLGRAAPVTVKVYNRAGRLVRELMSGQTMNAGANLVRWDGRDGDTNLTADGLYLIVVDALGQKQSKTIAVVR